MTAPIRSILLLQAGALGDTVLQLRLAQVLKQACGEVAITWLGCDAWLPIVRRCGHVDRLVGMDAMRAHRLFEEGERTDGDLADWLGSFDLIVNGLVPEDSSVAGRLRRFARQAVVTYDTKPGDGVVRHIVWQWLEQILPSLSRRWPDAGEQIDAVARQLMAEPSDLFESAEQDKGKATALLRAAGIDAGNDSRLILVHPGSGGRAKCWPMDSYLQLLEILSQRGSAPVLVLGPVEMEQLGERVERLRRNHPLIIDPPLAGLVALMNCVSAYIGNDSGPTHLAGALGLATIALFGPTDPHIWRPIGPRVTVLESQECEKGWTDLPPAVVAATLAL